MAYKTTALPLSYVPCAVPVFPTGIIILPEVFRYAQIIRELPGNIGIVGVEPTASG